jgi:DNA gyrase subunit A
MEIGTVRVVDIEREMQEAYLDYAMSVIVARALPDVRDGLKPVHRRILYAMHDMGLSATAPYKKSARIVGEVLGKYHPHGDAAVYEAMARMAQDFSMRAPLVDGQGNFGSVDGDPPAAMRYTEARLTALAGEMLADIEKETVNFVENFDGTLTEPEVLPAKVPNFLVNGASGIAVAMATNVPPHNLGEICDALAFMIDQTIKGKGDDVSVEDLLQFVHGPDFPTGGIVYRYADDVDTSDENADLIRSAYAVGRGRFTVQARAHIEEMTRNRHRIVVTELPYQTNKTNLIERIAELARDAKIEGLTDLRDESDRQGMRIVIEMTRTAEPRQVLKQLFKLTPMQQTFGMNMLALVAGEPRLLPLKRALQLFVEHRQEIITRRSRYELDKARQRAHILEGLLTALANLDEVIATIRASRTVDTARTNLQRKFKLTEVQAQAILDMPLRRLAALERQKIEAEYKETLQRIKELESLLRSPKKILGVIRTDLLEIKSKFDTPRRTQIVAGEKGSFTAQDLVPEEDVIVSVSAGGRVCRWSAEQGFEPARGRQKDRLTTATLANTRDELYLFTADGRAIVVPAHRVPPGAESDAGTPVGELVGLTEQPRVVAVLSLPPLKEEETTSGFLFLASRLGRVKRVSLADLTAARTAEIPVMKLDAGDELGWAARTAGGEDVLLVVSNGQAIRFSEEEVRPTGLPAGGVMGVKMGDKDRVVGMGVGRARGDLVVISELGSGKRSDLSEYPTQGRHGTGVLTASLTDKTGRLAAGVVAGASDRLLMVSEKGNSKVVYVRSLPKAARATRGRELIAIRGRDRLASLLVLPSPATETVKPVSRDGSSRPSSAGGQVKTSSAKTGGQGRPSRTKSDGGQRKTSKTRSTGKNEGSRPAKGGGQGTASKRGSTGRSKPSSAANSSSQRKTGKTKPTSQDESSGVSRGGSQRKTPNTKSSPSTTTSPTKDGKKRSRR